MLPVVGFIFCFVSAFWEFPIYSGVLFKGYSHGTKILLSVGSAVWLGFMGHQFLFGFVSDFIKILIDFAYNTNF